MLELAGGGEPNELEANSWIGTIGARRILEEEEEEEFCSIGGEKLREE